MFVACGRCQSEYEFDDALISEKGTNVFCTTCGHQFKVYPAADSPRGETWRLFRSGRAGEAIVYHSFRALQRSIAAGEVDSSDLLARGEGPARPIRSIVELAPLLDQPRSVPPPRGSSAPPSSDLRRRGGGGTPADPTISAGGTILGLSAPRVPEFGSPGPAPPRVREEEEEHDASEGETAHEVPEDREPFPEGPREDSSPAVSSAPEQRLPRVSSVLSGATPVSKPVITHRSSELEFKTPTPPLSGRTSSVDSEPFSKVPGTDRGRGARGVWLLVVVLGGAAAFFLISARDKLVDLTSSSVDHGDVDRAKALLDQARQAQAEAEESWLRERLVTSEERTQLSRALTFHEKTLADLLAQLGSMNLSSAEEAERLILLVHLRRMRGDLAGARAALAQLDPEVLPDSYALAMLDLAEVEADRPFAIILSRLKEASTGERGRFLVRSAYIYALIVAGRLDQARSDLAALSQLKGGQQAPLFADLQKFLERQSNQREAEEGASSPRPRPPGATATP